MRADAPVPTRKDPVCGMLLSPRSAAFEGQHAGKIYYFRDEEPVR
jgi:YHS domain-containing protein